MLEDVGGRRFAREGAEMESGATMRRKWRFGRGGEEIEADLRRLWVKGAAAAQGGQGIGGGVSVVVEKDKGSSFQVDCSR